MHTRRHMDTFEHHTHAHTLTHTHTRTHARTNQVPQGVDAGKYLKLLIAKAEKKKNAAAEKIKTPQTEPTGEPSCTIIMHIWVPVGTLCSGRLMYMHAPIFIHIHINTDAVSSKISDEWETDTASTWGSVYESDLSGIAQTSQTQDASTGKPPASPRRRGRPSGKRLRKRWDVDIRVAPPDGAAPQDGDDEVQSSRADVRDSLE
jgi:hypothetical protein